MAVFGLKYWAEMRSKYQGILWKCEIAQRGYTGPSEQMTFSGISPIKITWERRGDDFYTPVKASEASVNILCTHNFHYLGLFTSDPREYRMSLYRNGTLFWRGFLVADLYSEKFAAPPYEITIKAVDGFNILSNIDFKDILGMGTTGKKNLYNLLSTCISVLELDMSVSQWIDLIPEGLTDTASPLLYVTLDLARLFYVYENPTYRDVLELCLAPFGAQIFQSGGCIHVRRVVSLYDEYRPWYFSNLVHDRKKIERITTEDDERLTQRGKIRIVSVESTRQIQTDLWEDGFYMIGENTTLDIVPAIRNISVAVKNKALDNLAEQLGFTVPSMWGNNNGDLTFGADGSMTLTGNSDHIGNVLQTSGCPVKQCNFDLKWEMMLKPRYSSYTSPASGSSSSHTSRPHTVTIHFGVKIVGSSSTYWLDADGGWNDYETDMEVDVETGNEANFKLEIDGIPIDGTWYFYINQTLIGRRTSYGHTYTSTYEFMILRDVKMSIDAGDIYDQGLLYKTLVNPANNADLDIQLPVSDIPAIPNDLLLYSLYFEKYNGGPTRLWRTKGKEDYATLVDHMALACLKMRQLPAKRLNGEIFTSLHLDLNSVILDDKYLHAGFFVNSLEVDGLGDSYNAELVELPRLVNPDIPPQGDDCVVVFEIDTSTHCIQNCIRCLDFILLQTDRDEIYRFDTVTRQAVLLYSSIHSFQLFEAMNGYVRVEDGVAYFCDYRGVVRRQLELPNNYGGFVTFREDEFWGLEMWTTSGAAGTSTYRVLRRLGVATTYQHVAGTSHGDPLVYIYGDLGRVVVTKNQIAITTSRYVYMYDCRYHTNPNVFRVMEYGTLFAVSDDYLVMQDPQADVVKLYRRDSITAYSEIMNVNRWCNHAAISQTKLCVEWDAVPIYDLVNGTHVPLRNYAADDSHICGVFFVYGDLYIVREQGIYKYIPGSI